MIADRSNTPFTDVLKWPITGILAYLRVLPKIERESPHG
jgi:hypothetical protein